MFQAIRVTEYWQRACVYYIRLDEFVHEFPGGVAHELDSGDTPETPYILVMDERGKPVGTCRLHYLGNDVAKIERVSVLKEFRRTGAGRVVIAAAEEWLRENGIRRIRINSRDTAIGFYERLGYTTDWASHKGGKGGPMGFGVVDTYKNLTDE